MDAATQTTRPAGERNRTATFVTSTDCTTLRLTPKQASNGIGSRSRLSPISRRRKVPHEADSPLSSKTSSPLIIPPGGRSIPSEVRWGGCRILTDSELLPSSLMSSLGPRPPPLDSNIMNSSWFKNKNMPLFVPSGPSPSSWSFDALINRVGQVPAYESSNNEDSQMQYLSRADIVTSTAGTSVFAGKDERLACSDLESVCRETISPAAPFHQKSCTPTPLFVPSPAASSVVATWHACASRRRRELRERLEHEASYAKKYPKKKTAILVISNLRIDPALVDSPTSSFLHSFYLLNSSVNIYMPLYPRILVYQENKIWSHLSQHES